MEPIERKGSENLAKSGATVVGQSNLGQPPKVQRPNYLKNWLFAMLLAVILLDGFAEGLV